MFSFKHIFSLILFLALSFALPHQSLGTIATILPRDDVGMQVGFQYGLNWDFVIGNSQAAAQIFRLLPRAIAYDLGVAESAVKIDNIVPLSRDGYVATVARFHVPDEKSAQLRIDLATRASNLYNHPDALVQQLTNMIDRSIPFDP